MSFFPLGTGHILSSHGSAYSQTLTHSGSHPSTLSRSAGPLQNFAGISYSQSQQGLDKHNYLNNTSTRKRPFVGGYPQSQDVSSSLSMSSDDRHSRHSTLLRNPASHHFLSRARQDPPTYQLNGVVESAHIECDKQNKQQYTSNQFSPKYASAYNFNPNLSAPYYNSRSFDNTFSGSNTKNRNLHASNLPGFATRNPNTINDQQSATSETGSIFPTGPNVIVKKAAENSSLTSRSIQSFDTLQGLQCATAPFQARDNDHSSTQKYTANSSDKPINDLV